MEHMQGFGSAFGVRATAPEYRVAELAALSVVTVDLSSSSGAPAMFTRQSLRAILGGNVMKALAVR